MANALFQMESSNSRSGFNGGSSNYPFFSETSRDKILIKINEICKGGPKIILCPRPICIGEGSKLEEWFATKSEAMKHGGF